MQYNLFSLLMAIACVFFFSLHLAMSIKHKKFLCGFKPYAWVKESLDAVNIHIKMDIVSIIIFSILSVLICMLKNGAVN